MMCIGSNNRLYPPSDLALLGLRHLSAPQPVGTTYLSALVMGFGRSGLAGHASRSLLSAPFTTHRCFLSHDHCDQRELADFVRVFDHAGEVFHARGIGEVLPGNVINSSDSEYVMRTIRERYIRNATVTIVLLGEDTWSRRFVDWEIQASLYQRDGSLPNGLLGIKLPSFTVGGPLPQRLVDNLPTGDGLLSLVSRFAEIVAYPQSPEQLAAAIERAFQRRTTHGKLIRNPRERLMRSLSLGPEAMRRRLARKMAEKLTFIDD